MSKSKLTAPGAMALILIGLSGCATYAGDRQITANVRTALDQHPDLGPPNSINVETVNHVVYLTGRVSEGAMRLTAESVARDTQGVLAGRSRTPIYVTK